MTLIWLVVCFIADRIGDSVALIVNPVNIWAATLILAVALDLGAGHADRRPRLTRGYSRD